MISGGALTTLLFFPVNRRPGVRSEFCVCGATANRCFIEPEFSSYLLVNGKEFSVRWFEKEAEVEFDGPNEALAASFLIRGLIREPVSRGNLLAVIAPIGALRSGMQSRPVHG